MPKVLDRWSENGSNYYSWIYPLRIKNIEFGIYKEYSLYADEYALKETVSLISNEPPCRDCNARFTTVP